MMSDRPYDLWEEVQVEAFRHQLADVTVEDFVPAPPKQLSNVQMIRLLGWGLLGFGVLVWGISKWIGG